MEIYQDRKILFSRGVKPNKHQSKYLNARFITEFARIKLLTSFQAEEYINQSDSEDDVAPSASNDNIQWLIFGLKVALSITLYLLCLKLEIGALFVIVFAFYIILSNLSNRRKKHSEPSAYSVFNPNCEAIDGTINPEQFEKEIRYGF